MHRLRQARFLARFLLVWFALSIGVAVASPLVNPKVMQLVCTGSGAMKLVVPPTDGGDPSPSHALDCPLCAATSAPPASRRLSAEPTQVLAQATWPAVASTLVSLARSPLPPRGPPAKA